MEYLLTEEEFELVEKLCKALKVEDTLCLKHDDENNVDYFKDNKNDLQVDLYDGLAQIVEETYEKSLCSYGLTELEGLKLKKVFNRFHLIDHKDLIISNLLDEVFDLKRIVQELSEKVIKAGV